MEPKGWVCLWRTTLRDEKVRSLTDRQKWVWVGLLCMASQNGKTTGHIVNETTGAPLSIREIAGELGVDHTTVARAIDRMTSVPLKMLRVLEPAQGRRPALLQVVNFRRYQYVDGVAPAQRKPIPVASDQHTKGGTVADSVAEEQRNAQQLGLLLGNNTSEEEDEEHGQNRECATVAEEQHNQDKKYKKRRSTPTSKDSADADKPRGGEHAALTDRAWKALGLPVPVDGRSYGFTGGRKKARGLRLFSEWVSYLEAQGPEEPFDPTAEPLAWFKDAFNAAMRQKAGWGWRKDPPANAPPSAPIREIDFAHMLVPNREK